MVCSICLIRRRNTRKKMDYSRNDFPLKINLEATKTTDEIYEMPFALYPLSTTTDEKSQKPICEAESKF